MLHCKPMASSNHPIRIVFLGTPTFSVPTLHALLVASNQIEVLGVVTQPDKPAGRGQTLLPTPIKQAALDAGLVVRQPKSIRKDAEVIGWLQSLAPDYLVTIAFGQILSQEVLDIPKHGTVNVHASLLPEFRGANPIQQAVLQGKTETGMTTMLTDIGVDTGAMLLKTTLPIGSDETAGELAARMAEAGGPLLLETLQAHHLGQLKPTPQPHELATHAPKCDKADALIDWTLSAEEIHNRVRAFNPAPGAYTFLRDIRVKILNTQRCLASDDFNSEEKLKSPEPGEICDIIKSGMLVKTGDGLIQVTQVQPAGKKAMLAADWARGVMKPGELIGFTQTPALSPSHK